MGPRTLYRPNKTLVFVFHTCFYVLLAIGPRRGPAGRGVGGKVNLPPPIGVLRDVRPRVDGFRHILYMFRHMVCIFMHMLLGLSEVCKLFGDIYVVLNN